jgi:two-component system alkaline phosphatase synthesis response regulator PhoP
MSVTILVIDDDDGILDATKDVLEDEGYTVLTSTTPAIVERLAEAGGPRPQLILLDVFLSGSDGRDVCRHLKAGPATRAIPVILMSAHPGARSGAFASGADSFLPKPYDLDELLVNVESCLQLKHGEQH